MTKTPTPSPAPSATGGADPYDRIAAVLAKPLPEGEPERSREIRIRAEVVETILSNAARAPSPGTEEPAPAGPEALGAREMAARILEQEARAAANSAPDYALEMAEIARQVRAVPRGNVRGEVIRLRTLLLERTNELDRLRSARAPAEGALRALRDACAPVVDGMDHSDPDCPQDDTCACVNMALINDAFRRADRVLSPRPAPEGPDEWAELERLAKEATPGRWKFNGLSDYPEVRLTKSNTIVAWSGFDQTPQPKDKRVANARFIAAANPKVILALIAAARGR